MGVYIWSDTETVLDRICLALILCLGFGAMWDFAELIYLPSWNNALSVILSSDFWLSGLLGNA